MAILADYHMHTNYSGDSQATMESMIESAIAKGLSHICFTDHLDLDYPYGKDDTPGMFELRTDSYIYSAAVLKEKYEGKLHINIGVELGLQPHITKENTLAAQAHNYDFIIGSSHVAQGIDPYNPEFFEGKTDEEAYRAYFESILENIQVFDHFDVYGHLDYVVRYGMNKNKDYKYSTYQDVLDAILQELIKKNKGIECNNSGFAKGLSQPNPCFEILKRYHELGGEILTVGSDAHAPEFVGYEYARTCELLKEAGFRYYTIFDGHTPQYLKL